MASARRWRVAGYDADPAVRDTALTAKAVDEALDRMDRIDESVDLVVVALPRSRLDAIARSPALRSGRSSWTSLDHASVRAADRAPLRASCRRTPCLPRLTRIRRRARGASILIGSSLDPGSPGATVAGLWSSIGVLPAAVAPTLHDALFALTHDLSILSSAALVRTLRRTGSLTRLLAPASRAVLDDATRPAASAPSAETLAINAPKLVPALELLEREVRRLRHALAEGGPELGSLLDEARQFRQELVR
jgi:cyclohexadieny/prephenate dehydrogenase